MSSENNKNRDGTWVDMRSSRRPPARSVVVPTREPAKRPYIIQEPQPASVTTSSPVTKPKKTRDIKQLSLAVLLRPVKRVRKLSRKQRVVLVGVIILLIIIITLTHVLITAHPKTAAPVSKATVTKLLTDQSPEFNAILPTGKSIASLGGWTRVNPPNPTAAHAYIYTDKINKASIFVSEQPLPDSFKDDTDASIKALATSFNATEKINVGNVTVYLVANSTGNQSLVFTKSGLLILINSSAQIDNASWIQYINTLQ